MKLETWIQNEIDSGRASGKKDAYRQLAAEIGSNAKEKGGETVSAQTIESAAGGMRLRKYGKAKAIEIATSYRVTVAELCE